MLRLHLKLAIVLIIGVQFFNYSQEKKIELEGLIIDESNFTIPYAAVGIPSKYVGTASTEDGTFYLQVSKSNFADSLEVSSIGYTTFKIKVQDFINLKEKAIVLKEDIVSLDEVNILAPTDYVKLAVKNLRKTTINGRHQLNVLYRRFSTEDKKARFLVEHYINVLDNGPVVGLFDGIEVVTGRKSADYRFIKKKLYGHPMSVIGKRNPLRSGFRIKDYKWTRKGDTSYDGEDIIIIEGVDSKKKWSFIRLYIGMDTYGVYKLETGDLSALYIYKKDANGKLHLSYHNRTRTGKVELSAHQKRLLNTDKNVITESYKHEVFVLGVQTDKKIVNSADYMHHKKDIGDIEVKYDPVFWLNFSLPPETAFYKKSKQELESIFGVPLETQFNAVNK
jgi:hypothetical protein